MKNIITKIVGWLNRIPADKYKHFAAGAAIAAAVLLVGALILSKWAAVSASMIIVGLVGAAKEIYDDRDDRTDRSDIFATSLGGLAVWIAYLIG